MTQASSRFTRQPAHVLMLDLSEPFNQDTLENVYQGLTDFFSLVTHVSGPCRVPLFGLTAIGQYPETIFPVQTVKGNFSRLYSIITEFKRSAVDTALVTFKPEPFAQGFKDVVSQYQRQQQTLRQVQANHTPCQLEISILSCQPASFISEQVNKLAESLDLNVLKKVQVLSITVQNGQNENSQSTPSDNGSGHSDNHLISGMVDIVPLENDYFCFLNFFKTWLKDCGTDRESIHIILPSKLNSSPELMEEDVGTSTNQMILKCDLQEAFIDPSSLLCSEYFSLRGDFSFSKAYSPSNNKAIKGSESNSKILKLKAFCLVKTNGVCESVVYGLPMFVRPTCCWKLDWEELESNQQDFNALCSVLHEKDLSLVVKSEPEEHVQNVPQVFYLIMASSNSTLLIKSIAVQELMLPSSYPSLAEKISQESTEIIEESLNQLPVQEIYNPFTVKSDLFKYFISKTLKNNPNSRGSKRRFQAPQKAPETSNTASKTSGGRRYGQNVTRQPSKKMAFQSPRVNSTPLVTTSSGRNTSTPRRSKTLPAVAVWSNVHLDFTNNNAESINKVSSDTDLCNNQTTLPGEHCLGNTVWGPWWTVGESQRIASDKQGKLKGPGRITDVVEQTMRGSWKDCHLSGGYKHEEINEVHFIESQASFEEIQNLFTSPFINIPTWDKFCDNLQLIIYLGTV